MATARSYSLPLGAAYKVKDNGDKTKWQDIVDLDSSKILPISAPAGKASAYSFGDVRLYAFCDRGNGHAPLVRYGVHDGNGYAVIGVAYVGLDNNNNRGKLLIPMPDPKNDAAFGVVLGRVLVTGEEDALNIPVDIELEVNNR